MIDNGKDLFIPIVLTILTFIVWAVFMLLHVVLWSFNYDWLQNLAIILLPLVIVVGIVGIMWVYWIFKRV